LYVKNFPALPSDKAYQLWMRQNGKPVSMGVFKVDSSGNATVVFWTPSVISSFSNVGVTLEPVNGSPSPTGSAIVRGILQY
jgi:anti-sigma-K factor RskA